MSDYNQKDQGKQNPKGHQPARKGGGQTPPPKPGQQNELPDQSNLQNQFADQQAQQTAPSGEKGLIHQLPGGESG
ncbi:MAG: hypothetical protein J0G28_02865 [Afipia sp.]|nr:hypothetical protein [Afipia sp.]